MEQMNMTTLLSATNRHHSMTRKVTEKYAELLKDKGIEHRVMNLENIPVQLINEAFYKKGENDMKKYAHEIFQASDRFIIISPEYNGSIPGILKLLIDSCNPDIFKGKKFALVGVSSGRAGNLRGMDHLTDILHYLNAEVYSVKQPISQIFNLLNEEKELIDQTTIQVLTKQLDGFMKF